MALGEFDGIVAPTSPSVRSLFRSLAAAIVASTSVDIFTDTKFSIKHGKYGFLHIILNVRSINIAEIALDFNRRMRA